MTDLAFLSSREPDGEVLFVDSTWQDRPEWREGDTWVCSWGPSLAVDAPPFPGAAVRTVANAGGTTLSVEATVTTAIPRTPLHLVASTTIVIGDHGMYLSAGDSHCSVQVASGMYLMEIWVDAALPELVTSVAFRLGDQMGRPESFPVR